MSPAQETADTPAASAQRKSLRGRILAIPARMFAHARQNPLLAVVILCGGSIIMASGTSILVYGVKHGLLSDRQVTIEAALEQLDAGDYDKAKELADRLRVKLTGDYTQLGDPLFVQGAALVHEAEGMSQGTERKTLYLVAAHYLEEARDRGFPPGRTKEGRYLLATSLFHSGSYAESLRPLLEALKNHDGHSYELYHLLATAYLRDSQPDYRKSLQYNRLWLQNPSMSRATRNEAMLQQSEILLHLREAAACHAALDQIDEDSPLHADALILLARLLMLEGDALLANRGDPNDVEAQATAGKDKYRQAIGVMERAQSKDMTGAVTRQSLYLLGVCHQKLGDLRGR